MTDKKITILNVDDDDVGRYTLSRVLRQAGFEVIEAANGAESLRLVRENPDLVVLDVNLPDMSGFDVCRRIKTDPVTSLIPVLHVSATYMDSQSMVRGLDYGADGYLTQPVEPPVLIAYVKALLRMRQSERELLAAARQWRTTFDAIGDAVCLLDMEGRVLRCNVAMTSLLGKSFDEIIGRTYWEVMHGTSEPIEGYPIVRMRESRRRETLVLPMGERWLEVSADPLLDEDGDLIGSVHIMSDITERVRGEEALRESEQKYRHRFIQPGNDQRSLYTFSAIMIQTERKRPPKWPPEGQNGCLCSLGSALHQKSVKLLFWRFETMPKYRTLVEQSLQGLVIIQDFRIVFANTAFAEISGYTIEELLSLSPEKVRAMIHPEDQAFVWGRFRDRLAGKPVPPRYEYRGIQKDGAVRWLEMFASRIEYAGKPAIQGAIVDITERKRAEEALRERLKELTCLYAVHRDMQEELSIDELCRRIIEHLVPAMRFPDITAPVIELGGKRLTSERYTEELSHGLHAEIMVEGKARGHLRVYYAEDIPFLVPEEQDLLNAIAEDLGVWLERMRAEEALRESEETARALLNAPTDVAALMDTRGTILVANEAMAARFGMPVNELVGMYGWDLIPPGLVERRKAYADQVIQSGEPRRFEDESRGTWFDNVFYPVFDAQGKVTKVAILGRDITERKQMEEALRESEDRYRAVSELTSDYAYAFRVEPDGTLVAEWVTGALVRITGFTAEELQARGGWESMIHPNDMSIPLSQLQAVMAGKSKVVEYRILTKDGEVRWTRDYARSVWDEGQGRTTYIYGAIQDITERKQVEEALRESEEKYRNLVENINDVLFATDENGVITYISPQIKPVSGYSPSEIIGRPFREFLYQEDLPHVMQQFQKVLSGHIEPSEYRIVTKSGEIRWVRSSSRPILVGNRPIGLQGMLTDITERKRIEKALRDSETRFRSLVEQSPFSTALYTPDGQPTYGNPATAKLWNMTPEQVQLVYQTYNILEDKQLANQGIMPDIRKGFAGEFAETPAIRYDPGQADPDYVGPVRWLRAFIYPVKDEDGTIREVVVMHEDVTERKEAEEELRRLKEFNESIIQNMAEGIVVQDAEGYFTFVNPTVADMLGYGPEEMVGLHWTAIVPPDQQPIVEAADERRMRGEADRYELELVRRDGRAVSVLVSASPGFEEDRFAGILTVFTNITDRKRAEQLLQALNEAALAMERALTPEAIFAAVAKEFRKLDFSCTVLLTDESQSKLFPRHLSYKAGVVKAAEKLTGLKAEDFPILIESTGTFRRIVWEGKTVFVDTEEAIREVLPEPLKRFTRQIVSMLKIQKSVNSPLIADDQVIGVLSVQSDDLTEGDIPAITAFANQMAASWRKAQLLQDLESSLAEVERAGKEIRQSYVQLQRTLEGTVNTLVSAIEMRDPYTAGHQRRVTELASAIARRMGLSKERIEGIRMAGLIHDIGKISIPAEILSKPGRLSQIEYSLIRTHPQLGHDVVKAVEFPWPVAVIMLQHHERMDGSGYPQGLSGEEISLEARILAVADVVEAMASHRPYRPAHTVDEALDEISQNRGVLYDPEVVDACLKLSMEKGFTFE